jgi:hypothetical protein
MSSKICANAMETHMICHNYRIYHKNRIHIHAPVRVDVIEWLVEFVWYLLEIFTLFLWTIYYIYARNRTVIYDVRPVIGRWTGVLLRCVGEVWSSAWLLGADQRTAEAFFNYWKPLGSQYTDYIYREKYKFCVLQWHIIIFIHNIYCSWVSFSLGTQ